MENLLDIAIDKANDIAIDKANDIAIDKAKDIAIDKAKDIAIDKVENNIANEYIVDDVDDVEYDNIVPLEYLLEIQEISGKNIAQNYVDELISKFEKLNIKYEFELAPNEEDINLNKIVGGSDLTFPYNYFESFANNIKKLVNKTQNKEENKNYILNLFESKSKKEEDVGIENNNSESIDYIEEDKKKSALVLPKHYTGLIKIHLTIYDVSNKSNKFVGRIYDLSKWLRDKKVK